MRKTLLLTVVIFIAISCSNNSNSNSSNIIYPTCQSQDFITKFNSIPNSASYNDVKAVFGNNGDNYLNSTTINYKWYPCSDHNYYVDFWFQNNSVMIHKQRTISDFTLCSNNISASSFSSLIVGMTYSQVSSLLNCQGDNFRVDNPTTANTKYYRFYNCLDNSKYIEAWFSNDSSILITKNF